MVFFFWNGFTLHVHIGLPSTRFAQRILEIATDLFRQTFLVHSASVRTHKCCESAYIVHFMLTEVSIIGENGFCWILSIIIFIQHAIQFTIHRSAVIMMSYIMTKDAILVTKAIRK